MNYRDKPLKLFIQYIAHHKKLFAIDMVCALAVAVIDLVFPYVSRQSMYRFLPDKLFTTFFVVMGVMIVAGVGICAVSTVLVVNRLVGDGRDQIYAF